MSKPPKQPQPKPPPQKPGGPKRPQDNRPPTKDPKNTYVFRTEYARQVADRYPGAAEVIAGAVASCPPTTTAQVDVLRRALPPVERATAAAA